MDLLAKRFPSELMHMRLTGEFHEHIVICPRVSLGKVDCQTKSRVHGTTAHRTRCVGNYQGIVIALDVVRKVVPHGFHNIVGFIIEMPVTRIFPDQIIWI